MNIPILIISYNNYKYVQNTINQLRSINEQYVKDITIVDNNSSCRDTIKYLHSLDHKIIFRSINNGPRISREYNTDLYDQMPDKFVITDPDLEFNKKTPKNFIEILSDLSDKYNSHKTGLALNISDYDKMFSGNYYRGYNIPDWEEQFWKNKVTDDDYSLDDKSIYAPLYYAGLDTTFNLVNKRVEREIGWKSWGITQIRVSGDFLANHIPWYIENKLFTLEENYILCKKQSDWSTTSKLVVNYVEKNYEFSIVPSLGGPDILSLRKKIINI